MEVGYLVLGLGLGVVAGARARARARAKVGDKVASIVVVFSDRGSIAPSCHGCVSGTRSCSNVPLR